MQIVAARSPEHWAHANELLSAYRRELATGPDRAPPEGPHMGEPDDITSAFATYFIAYVGVRPVGGTGVVSHDESSVAVTHCYVVPELRQRGVARQLNAAVLRLADRQDARRVVVAVPTAHAGAVEAWRRMGFVDTEPWGDESAVYLEHVLGDGAGVGR